MGFYTLAGILVLAGALVAAFLPRGQRWLAVAGLAAASLTGIILWLSGRYDDAEVSPWIAVALVVILLGGGWSVGIGVGNLMREGLIRRRERMR
jgi:hypothetical protein